MRPADAGTGAMVEMSDPAEDKSREAAPLDKPLFDLAFSMSEGLIDEQGSKQINDLLAANKANRAAYLQLLHVIAGLEWQGPRMSPADLGVEAKRDAVQGSTHVGTSAASSAQRKGLDAALAWKSPRATGRRRFVRSRVGLAIAMLAGVAVGSIVTWQVTKRTQSVERIDLLPPLASNGSSGGSDRYVATLVNVTNCRWDTVRSTADLHMGSQLRPGESLHLLEGLAQIQSAGSSNTVLQLEGPAAITLSREGMPSLLYGKLTASFSSGSDQFALDTPVGRVTVSGHASIGVSSAPNGIELHVFTGAATLDLWSSGIEASKSLTAKEGTSLSARVSSDGKIAVQRGESREAWFITPGALAKSQLIIPRGYISAVLRDKPAAYWRFEEADGGVMRNEVADRLHCHMVGDAVRWHTNGENGTAEFGVTAGPGYLLSDDSIDASGENYTFEAWVKPTYFHHGALFSLLHWEPSRTPWGSQRLEVELCGPVSGFPDSLRQTEQNPGRIRFIHRDVDCFSATPYVVRTWQHVAAVKEASRMKLYLNGELVASREDPRVLGADLRVLMGQLFPRSPYLKDEVTSRLFVGELDEVAFYEHALTPAQLKERVELARPDKRIEAENQNTAF